MSILILFCAVVIFSCIITNKFSSKLGMPALLFFMFLGVLFGSDGVLKISYDDYDLTSKLCSIGLLFIIFYGGFCTKKPENKKVGIQAALLSSVGTILTALFCAAFCFYVLKIPFAESFLIGAVISSTDAASVFSILRSKRLSLKHHSAPILEMESGSNDPFAYILTVLGISLMQGGELSLLSVLFVKQILIGLCAGVLIALGAIFIFKKTRLLTEGTDTLFMVAVALLAFALPDLMGGNGYLSVYAAGIVLGNSEIKNKINLIYFFDGLTALCQVIIFFLIGFLSFPHKIPTVLLPAVCVMLFLTFVARPLAVSLVMLPFKAPLSQIILLSAAGLRGAASIVFAIFAVAQINQLQNDLFHVVFVVVLLSVAFQGTFLPLIAKKVGMIDRFNDVRKTFNDYQQESAIVLNTLNLKGTHPWANKLLKDVNLLENTLILTIKRGDTKLIPNGNTLLLPEDELLMGTTFAHSPESVNLTETVIDEGHEWRDKKISEITFPSNFLIALIKRGKDYFVPNGSTRIHLNDTVVFYKA